MRKWLPVAVSATLVLLGASFAVAQYDSDFEALNASAAGVVLTGQDGYYIPAGTTSADWMAYTYAMNALGIPANPQGGDKFVAGRGPGGTTFARAQRDVEFGVGSGQWKIEYDFCTAFLGVAPSANNLGSFSIRYDDLNVHNIHLFSWVDPNNPVAYNAFYLAYDATGVQMAQPGTSPGPAWENLPLNQWYRSWMVIDLDQNLITEVGIENLTTQQETVYYPVDWYLVGGAAGAIGPPVNFRFFGGGSVDGNVACFDNMSIGLAQPFGACCLASGECLVVTSGECEALGGIDFFEGQGCDPYPCFPIPVEETSWGQIKNAYR